MANVGADNILPIKRGELDLTPKELIILGKELHLDGNWRFLAIPNDEYIIKPKPIPKPKPFHSSSSISSYASSACLSIEQSHPLYELIKNSHAVLSKGPTWLRKVHKILLILCNNRNCSGFLTRLHVNDPQFYEFSSKVSPLKYMTLQDVLEKLVNNGYESTTEALCDIYCVLICAFRLVDPGSDEWIKIHRISTLLSSLIVSENLKDNYIIKSEPRNTNRYKNSNMYNYGKRSHNMMAKGMEKSMYHEDFTKSQSEIEFEQELLRIAANKKSACDYMSNSFPTPIPPHVPPITYEERYEFQELLSTLPEDCHLELFTTFENSAVWKNVDDEIELDDHATDPAVFRSLIKWARDRQLNM